MSRTSSRDRLIESAQQLFFSQGIHETTTKQIAELAEVNEVTLFRQFGSKYGLLSGLLETTDVFTLLRDALGLHDGSSPHEPSWEVSEAVRQYASVLLELLDQGSAFVRSLVGESGQFSEDSCQALGRVLTQLNRAATQHLAETLPPTDDLDAATIQSLARLLNSMVLGYAVLEFTSDAHNLWSDREDFLEDVRAFFGRESPMVRLQADRPASDRQDSQEMRSSAQQVVSDLPANLVKLILQRAKKQGGQDYALAYLVFSTGLSVAEIAALERWHYINDPPQHLLQVTQGAVRQVPMNRWILGQRYGTDSRNPLNQWLNSRKDSWQAMFFVGEGTPTGEGDIRNRWRSIVEGLLTPQGTIPTLDQARQTWYVDMLMRGVKVEDLALLTALNPQDLQPYAHRAAEKAALERAMRLDAKPE